MESRHFDDTPFDKLRAGSAGPSTGSGRAGQALRQAQDGQGRPFDRLRTGRAGRTGLVDYSNINNMPYFHCHTLIMQNIFTVGAKIRYILGVIFDRFVA